MKATCHRCGEQFKVTPRTYTNICPQCPVPHMLLATLGGGRYRCGYCGQAGTEQQLRAASCTYVYDRCEHCGEAPSCALDCPGIAAILADPSIYVAGLK